MKKTFDTRTFTRPARRRLSRYSTDYNDSEVGTSEVRPQFLTGIFERNEAVPESCVNVSWLYFSTVLTSDLINLMIFILISSLE